MPGEQVDMKSQIEKLLGQEIPDGVDVDWTTIGMLYSVMGQSVLQEAADTIRLELDGVEVEDDEVE